MWEYDVKYSCGHEGKVKLWASKDTIEGKLRFYKEKGLCPACMRAKQEKREQERKNNE